MSNLKATPLLTRLCEHLAPNPRVQDNLDTHPDLRVPLQEDCLERRWRSREAGQETSAAKVTVPYPGNAIAMQINRAVVACDSARRALFAAKHTDKVLLKAMASCDEDIRSLTKVHNALSPTLKPSDPGWHPLLDQAYALGKAMDTAMQRLSPGSCASITLDLVTDSRGDFEPHEIYALASLLEQVDMQGATTPPCTEVRDMLHRAFLQHRKDDAKARRAGRGVGAPNVQSLPDAHAFMQRLTAAENANLQKFLDHPTVHAVLADAHNLHQDDMDARGTGDIKFPLSDAVMRARDNTSSIEAHALSSLMQDWRQQKNMMLGQAYRAMVEPPKISIEKADVDAFFRSKKDSAELLRTWEGAARQVVDQVLQPEHREPYLQAHSLRAHIEATFLSVKIRDMGTLFAKSFDIPETLFEDMRDLLRVAKQHTLSDKARKSVNAFGKKVGALYEEALGSNSIAMELRFVLDKRTQERLRDLRRELKDLATLVSKHPTKSTGKHRREKSAPSKSSPSSGFLASPLKAATLSADALAISPSEAVCDDDQFELDPPDSPPSAAEPIDSAAPSATGEKASAGAALRDLHVKGQPTCLRTRLSDAQALAFIDDAMAKGTFSSPLRSAIYHFRRHVLCELGIDTTDAVATARAAAKREALQDVTIEDYLEAALDRFNQWDGHTVTNARSNGELLALVEDRPRGWFTREGKVVSFCYEDR